MKIAILLPVNGISGGLYVAYQHGHYLVNRGHEVTIAFLNNALGTQVTHFRDFSLPTCLVQDLVDRDSHFDAIISGWWECFYAMFRIEADHYLHFIQGDDRESVRQQYGTRFPSDLPFIERAFSDSRVGYIVVAQWLKTMLEKSAELHIECAPNGIDTSLFNPIVRPLVPRGKKIRVLIEGGSVPFKRVDMAFRVASRIPDIEIWHVSGDGILDPGWKSNRTFQRVRQDEMPAIYASCDILLKLSVVEGFFGPPLEMMACGGTAVVSRVRGHEEYVVDGFNALTVPLDDVEGAYRALCKLIEDRDLRSRLSQEGIRTAKALDWSRRCPQFEEAILRLIGRVPPILRADRALHLAIAQLRDDNLQKTQRFEQQLADIRAIFVDWKLFRCWKSIRRRLDKLSQFAAKSWQRFKRIGRRQLTIR